MSAGLLLVLMNTRYCCRAPMDWNVFLARYVCGSCGRRA